jgi:hypothetical protein
VFRKESFSCSHFYNASLPMRHKVCALAFSIASLSLFGMQNSVLIVHRGEILSVFVSRDSRSQPRVITKAKIYLTTVLNGFFLLWRESLVFLFVLQTFSITTRRYLPKLQKANGSHA